MFRYAVLLLGLTGCNLVFGVDVPGDGGEDDVVVDAPPGLDGIPPLQGATRVTIDDGTLGLTDIRECTPDADQNLLVFTAIKNADSKRRLYVATDGNEATWGNVQELTSGGDIQTSSPRFDMNVDGLIDLAYSKMGSGNRRAMVYLEGTPGAPPTWTPIARDTFRVPLNFDFGMGGINQTGTGNPSLVADSADDFTVASRTLREFGDSAGSGYWDEVAAPTMQVVNEAGGGRNPFLTYNRLTIYYAGNEPADDTIFEAVRDTQGDVFAAPVEKLRIAAGRVSQPYYDGSHYYFTVDDAGAASGCYYY